ncbi:membrane protein [Paenibacillus swuensis]|uniref:Membrane protein n=2 Tax=Paenibacillus swuensis TaxID=1178515 RepID=A0A172THH5_9BACL|nr:DUF350 domain-containing protein [Paenibacillus swuensis]ANE46317.1 membrane protein [Paenibacillus swuensis]
MEGYLNDLSHVFIGMVLILVMMALGYFIFSKLTKFNDYAEIQKGNEAAGIYMGGKLLGLAIIVGMVSYSTDAWVDMIIWSVVGIVALCLVYIIFDFLTPALHVCEEIEKGNKSVAQLLRSIIVGVSLVIGTFLM